MSYRKRELKRLPNENVEGEVAREFCYMTAGCRTSWRTRGRAMVDEKVDVVIINKSEDTTFEKDLANDVLEIITVFSARLYGSRSHRNQKLIDGMRMAVKESQCT